MRSAIEELIEQVLSGIKFYCPDCTNGDHKKCDKTWSFFWQDGMIELPCHCDHN